MQTANIRDFKMPRRRRQQERQKSNRSPNSQNNNFARASYFFCTFLCRHCMTTTGKCLVSSFMEDVNKRRLIFFLFLNLNMVLRSSAQKGSLAFDKVNELE